MAITHDVQEFNDVPSKWVFVTSIESTVADPTAIIERFTSLLDHPDTHKSHFFGGRFENIYPPREAFPEIEPLINLVFSKASDLLQIDEPLGLSFWFNQMGPGHATTLHTHDEMNELLSAVFYLAVPPDSGAIRFHPRNSKPFEHMPQSGELLLFNPTLPHEVLANDSSETRLSVAFNIGLATHQVL